MVTKERVFHYSKNNKSFSYLQDKLIEEMAELTQAILKAREKGKMSDVNIDKEYGDVSLMMQQLRYCYDEVTDGQFSKDVAVYEQQKCDKLWRIWVEGILK